MNVRRLRSQPTPADIEPRPAAAVLPPAVPFAARLSAIEADGTLAVVLTDGSRLACDCLTGSPGPALAPGDEVLLTLVLGRTRPVVLGRIGLYVAPLLQPAATSQAQLTLEATQSISLKCGESSIELRADGKVMIRGDDVLVRAKGTQRIRAGTVSIN